MSDFMERAARIAVKMNSMSKEGSIEVSGYSLSQLLLHPRRATGWLARWGMRFSEAQQAEIDCLVEAGDLPAAQEIVLSELERHFLEASG